MSKVTRLNIYIYAYFVIVIVGGINNAAGNVLNHQWALNSLQDRHQQPLKKKIRSN